MIAKLLGAAALSALLLGCSIRIQAPVREVAYDFSDRDFYDRSYAPSPVYAAGVERDGVASRLPSAEGAIGQPVRVRVVQPAVSPAR